MTIAHISGKVKCEMGVLMAQPVNPAYQAYWEPSFQTLYEAYYQERLSEALVARWQWINTIIASFVAVTASGSTIAGLELWNKPELRYVWFGVAAIASVASIVNGVIGVPSRVKEQEDLRKMFSGLRVDLETFRQQLIIGLDQVQAGNEYKIFRQKLADGVASANPGIIHTEGLRRRVKNQLDEELRRKGDIS